MDVEEPPVDVEEPPVEVEVEDPPVEVEEPPVDVDEPPVEVDEPPVDEPPVEVEEPPVEVDPPLELDVDETTIPLDPPMPPPHPPPMTGAISPPPLAITGPAGRGTGIGAAWVATVTIVGTHAGVAVFTTCRTLLLTGVRFTTALEAGFLTFV